jgi:ribonuclease R
MTDAKELPGLKDVLKELETSRHGPMKARELARALAVPSVRYRTFKEQLRVWEAEGSLYRNRSQRYAAPSEIQLAVGFVQQIRSGDAFIRPEKPGQPEIFVSQRHLDSAMDGDRVAVHIEAYPRGRNPIGRVVKILERVRPTVVGTFQATTRFGFVSPLDRRVGRDILVPQDARGDAEAGDIVLVHIHQFADRHRNAVGEVVQVLGKKDDPGVDVLAILHGHGLPRAFPAPVEESARDAARWVESPGEREDLRHLMVFTIDPVDARDHDDALSIRRLEGGRSEVGIHIADVAHFVREGSPLDHEAFRRGTSVYLVDQVVPMLPHTLSSDLCSLKAGEDRFALSLMVTLDEEAQVLGHRYTASLIRTHHGLHYDQVQQVLDGHGTVTPEVDEALHALHGLAEHLRGRRRSRGSLDFDLPEARVVLDDEGMPVEIERVVQLDSHRLIESFMILANEIVAADLLARELPVPFRIHEPPTAEKAEALEPVLAPFGHTLGRGKIRPQRLQQILDAVQGRPEENLVSTVILRSMNRAIYAPENVGHFGLASEAYLHFTSPIRRYPDLVVHRVVRRVLLDGQAVPGVWAEGLDGVCQHASQQERLAQQAERDSIEMKKIEYMRRHLGDSFEGTISSVTSFGFFVLLDRVFVEGLVHVSTLQDDYYSFLPEAHVLVGRRNMRRFQLGDRVEVQVVRADKEERQIDFMLLSGGGQWEGELPASASRDQDRKGGRGPQPKGRGGKGGGRAPAKARRGGRSRGRGR